MFVLAARPPTGLFLGLHTGFSVIPGHSVNYPNSAPSHPNRQRGSCCLSVPDPALCPSMPITAPVGSGNRHDSEILKRKSEDKG